MLMCPTGIVAGARVMSAIISCSNVASILGDKVRLASMDMSCMGVRKHDRSVVGRIAR